MPRLALIVLALATTLAAAPVLLAKRAAPGEVAPVRHEGIEFRAPLNQMGSVEAWDLAAGELIWRRQVYVIRWVPSLERDVQDVFIKALEIKSLEPKGTALIVRNERGSEYLLNLATLEVKVLKGSLVESFR
jgi:hypothetical protein